MWASKLLVKWYNYWYNDIYKHNKNGSVSFIKTMILCKFTPKLKFKTIHNLF